jgi:septal ring factor EnvC (AmiA/AmiB activator)
LDGQRLVVRLHDPRRFRIVVAIAVVLALLLCLGLYELGQRAAGSSILKSDHRRQALRAEVAQLSDEQQALQEELARLRTSVEVDREAHQRLTDTLAEREARVAELNEELEFYRRIVAPADGQAGLRVQSMEVMNNSAAGGVAHSYRLRLLLVQSPQRSGRAQGQVDLSLRGTLHGEEASLTLRELAAEPQEFEFLYFQDVDLDVILPEGFEPESAEIELRPGQRNGRTVAASFPWKPKG